MNSRKLNKPCYSYGPIETTDQFAMALGLSTDKVLKTAQQADHLYRLADEIKKKDGTVRKVYDARSPLKLIQDRIKNRILYQVAFPQYLQGGLKGRSHEKNAGLHAGRHTIIAEDIKGFFPSVSTKVIHDIWQNFFRFSPEVAKCLTALTSKAGQLPQGSKTSAHLANLVFWKKEWKLVETLKKKGFDYSRYIDDVSISSLAQPDSKTIRTARLQLYELLRSQGLAPKYSKRTLHMQNRPMIVTGMVSNVRVNIQKDRKAKIRAIVHRCETLLKQGQNGEEYRKLYRNAQSRVGQLKIYDATEYAALVKRLTLIKL